MGQGLVITDQKTGPFILRMAPSQFWAALTILGQRAMERLEVLRIPHPPNVQAYTCLHTQTHTDIHTQRHTCTTISFSGAQNK